MLVKYIDGIPLFSTRVEAQKYFKEYGITTAHVHYYKKNSKLLNGYMPGSSHEDIIEQINYLGISNPEILGGVTAIDPTPESYCWKYTCFNFYGCPKGCYCSRVPRKELQSFISLKVDTKTKEVMGLISESDRKVIKEYGDGHQADFDTAYTDFDDQKLIAVIIKYLDKIIQFDGNILPAELPEDWIAYLHNEPFEEHLCYGCNGMYTYSTSGDINREKDSIDNDDTVSAIAISVSERMGGEWMDYYHVVHKYLQNRIKTHMKANDYPDVHEMEY